MALIQPPITGDPQLDSWTLQLTRQINSGLTPGGLGSSGAGGGGGAGADGTDGNSAIYLYQRTVNDNTVPVRPINVSYDFEDINNPIEIIDVDTLWSADIPETGGDFLWVTFRYVAGLVGTITDADSWDTPTLLGIPAITVTVTSHRLPDGITEDTFDYDNPGTLRASSSGFQFRTSGDEAKVLRADVYAGGTELTDHGTDWTYEWQMNGQGVDRDVMNREVNTRYLVITTDDVAPNGDDVFTCTVTDPS